MRTTGLRIGVLTVSDGVAAGVREDLSGARMSSGLEALGHVVAERAVVADEQAAIADVVTRWADEKALDAVVTLGGTGLGPRDVTPEATARVIERAVPGLAEALRAEGAKSTRAAYLSRGIAGVRGRTVVVNVAGSEGAARDALATLAALLPHSAHILSGGGHEANEGERAVRPPGRTEVGESKASGGAGDGSRA